MAHIASIKVEYKGADELKQALGKMLTPQVLTAINKEVGLNCQEHTADHIAVAGVSHHKSARMLGAKPTGHFEFAPSRVSSRSKAGGMTKSKGADPHGVTIEIANTPGIMMAFGEQTITPKQTKALTIPIHRIAYGKRARDLEAEGYSLFVPFKKGGQGKANYLMAQKGKGQGIPVYALRKSVTLPHLPDLMPTTKDYQEWATDTIEAEIIARKTALGL